MSIGEHKNCNECPVPDIICDAHLDCVYDVWVVALGSRKAIIPSIVCLCGSTRFFKEFTLANFNETMAGHIVLSVGFYHHSSTEAHGESIGISVSDKMRLDELHKRKIDLADEIFVINKGGYIGKSTHSEINYAITAGKKVRYLEPVH